MSVKAHSKYVRISPRKISIVLDLIRNKPVSLGMAILENTPKSACEYLRKLLKSAVANAVNNNKLDASKLVISECYVGQGPTLKRVQARARGRSTRIEKRSSHITIGVSEKNITENIAKTA